MKLLKDQENRMQVFKQGLLENTGLSTSG